MIGLADSLVKDVLFKEGEKFNPFNRIVTDTGDFINDKIIDTASKGLHHLPLVGDAMDIGSSAIDSVESDIGKVEDDTGITKFTKAVNDKIDDGGNTIKKTLGMDTNENITGPNIKGRLRGIGYTPDKDEQLLSRKLTDKQRLLGQIKNHLDNLKSKVADGSITAAEAKGPMFNLNKLAGEVYDGKLSPDDTPYFEDEFNHEKNFYDNIQKKGDKHKDFLTDNPASFGSKERFITKNKILDIIKDTDKIKLHKKISIKGLLEEPKVGFPFDSPTTGHINVNNTGRLFMLDNPEMSASDRTKFNDMRTELSEAIDDSANVFTEDAKSRLLGDEREIQFKSADPEKFKGNSISFGSEAEEKLRDNINKTIGQDILSGDIDTVGRTERSINKHGFDRRLFDNPEGEEIPFEFEKTPEEVEGSKLKAKELREGEDRPKASSGSEGFEGLPPEKSILSSRKPIPDPKITQARDLIPDDLFKKTDKVGQEKLILDVEHILSKDSDEVAKDYLKLNFTKGGKPIQNSTSKLEGVIKKNAQKGIRTVNTRIPQFKGTVLKRSGGIDLRDLKLDTPEPIKPVIKRSGGIDLRDLKLDTEEPINPDIKGKEKDITIKSVGSETSETLKEPEGPKDIFQRRIPRERPRPKSISDEPSTTSTRKIETEILSDDGSLSLEEFKDENNKAVSEEKAKEIWDKNDLDNKTGQKFTTQLYTRMVDTIKAGRNLIPDFVVEGTQVLKEGAIGGFRAVGEGAVEGLKETIPGATRVLKESVKLTTKQKIGVGVLSSITVGIGLLVGSGALTPEQGEVLKKQAEETSKNINTKQFEQIRKQIEILGEGTKEIKSKEEEQKQALSIVNNPGTSTSRNAGNRGKLNSIESELLDRKAQQRLNLARLKKTMGDGARVAEANKRKKAAIKQAKDDKDLRRMKAIEKGIVTPRRDSPIPLNLTLNVSNDSESSKFKKIIGSSISKNSDHSSKSKISKTITNKNKNVQTAKGNKNKVVTRK